MDALSNGQPVQCVAKYRCNVVTQSDTRDEARSSRPLRQTIITWWSGDWRSGSMLVKVNEVNLRRAWFVDLGPPFRGIIVIITRTLTLS